MGTRTPKPSRPFEWVIYVFGVIGLILMMLGRRRYDWLYPDPDVPWRGWLALVGFVLCGVWGVWTLWNLGSPYSVDTQDDENATVTLGLNSRSEDNDRRVCAKSPSQN